MAIYHLSVKAISRSKGRSVVAASAYRTGTCLIDERQGITHDYINKRGIETTFIVAPKGAEWAEDRNRLWNAAEHAEKRKDAKTGREYELALPAELDGFSRQGLAVSFAQELVRRFNVVADVAVHEPSLQGDNRNHHAHILTTTRTVDSEGMGQKTRILDVSSTASVEIEQLRAFWAEQVNQALERHKINQRVDHRSFERQGKDQEPSIHMGVAATAMERQAVQRDGATEAVTDLGKKNAAIRERNRLLEVTRQAVEKARELVSELEEKARFVLFRLARNLGRAVELKREKERQQEREELRKRREEEHERKLRAEKEARSRSQRRDRDTGYSPGF